MNPRFVYCPRICLGLCAGLILVLGGSIASAGDASRLPGCAETAVFSFLYGSQKQLPLSSISREFEKLPEFDPYRVSIKDLRGVLDQLGVATDAIRVRPDQLTDLPRPCILYFRPGYWVRGPRDAGTGHFVTLLDIDEDQQRVRLADWAPLQPQADLQMSLDEFSQRWHGEAIVPARSAAAQWIAWFGVLVLVVGAIWHWFKQHRNKNSAAAGVTSGATSGGGVVAMSLLGLLLLSGCGEESAAVPSGPPNLVFQQPVVDQGIVMTDDFEVSFPFTVGEQPVKITKVETTCGCMTVNDELLNQSLAARSRHELKMRVSTRGFVGAQQAPSMRVYTEPESPVALLLAVTYRRGERPVVSAEELVVRPAAGEIVRPEFTITYHRSPSDPQVLLDRSQSRLDGFSFEDISTRTEIDESKIPGNQTRIAIDTTVVKLKSLKSFGYGERRFIQQLAFSDGSKQEMLIRVEVRHPFLPQLPLVFAGRLQPNEAWSVDVPVRRTKVDCTIKDIDQEGHPVQVEPGIESLTISGRAPSAPGRFKSQVTLQFSPQHIPEVRIPISGLVIDNAGK